MEKNVHKEIYKSLFNILGPERISDDPAVMEAYTRDILPPGILNPSAPEFVALPASTKEVQAIIKLANRYKFSFMPVGSNMWSINTVANRPKTLIIDPKRMNKIIEIDKKNMLAVIEPYVTHAQLQAEANKNGLYIGSPMVGGQASSLANHCLEANWGVSYRIGMGYRNILGMEWVLPNGDILRTGSFCMPEAGYFHGEGPGPDLRGLLRGSFGVSGGHGMVTKMAVKLHPWPGPPRWPVEGITPDLKSVLPEERFKWYLFRYPTLEDAIDAMYEIGRAEIGAVCHIWPPLFLNSLCAKSNEEYWNAWKEKYWQTHCGNMVSISLWGFTSERQLHYESSVLEDIIYESGGEVVPDEVYNKVVPYMANDYIRASNGCRLMRGSGNFFLYFLSVDTIDSVLSSVKRASDIIAKNTPPAIDSSQVGWIVPFEFGHFCYVDIVSAIEKTVENMKRVFGSILGEAQKDLNKKVCHEMGMAVGAPYHAMAGPVFGNYHLLMKGIKKAIDSNNVSNPPQPISIEEGLK